MPLLLVILLGIVWCRWNAGWQLTLLQTWGRGSIVEKKSRPIPTLCWLCSSFCQWLRDSYPWFDQWFWGCSCRCCWLGCASWGLFWCPTTETISSSRCTGPTSLAPLAQETATYQIRSLTISVPDWWHSSYASTIACFFSNPTIASLYQARSRRSSLSKVHLDSWFSAYESLAPVVSIGYPLIIALSKA